MPLVGEDRRKAARDRLRTKIGMDETRPESPAGVLGQGSSKKLQGQREAMSARTILSWSGLRCVRVVLGNCERLEARDDDGAGTNFHASDKAYRGLGVAHGDPLLT
jgi:hypothetical protein